MRINQVSVFLGNTPGRLESLCKALADASVNLETLTITESADHGIVRMIVSDADRAVEVLSKQGFTPKKVEVLAVEVDDTPGALLKLLQKTREAGVNVEYMYDMSKPSSTRPLMVMSFKDMDTAEKILKNA
ncbi:MAG: amino acid-binding protein [Opitutales bacterium]|nr:amino acid-binding protein [Opitutales bacterium]